MFLVVYLAVFVILGLLFFRGQKKCETYLNNWLKQSGFDAKSLTREVFAPRTPFSYKVYSSAQVYTAMVMIDGELQKMWIQLGTANPGNEHDVYKIQYILDSDWREKKAEPISVE